MKKIIITVLMCLAATLAYANTTASHTNENPYPTDPIAWEFTKKWDGLVFLLGLYSEHTLLIRVPYQLANGESPDPITVTCNNTTYHLGPESQVICHGQFADQVSMMLSAQDYRNGSAGTYTYVPLQKT